MNVQRLVQQIATWFQSSRPQLRCKNRRLQIEQLEDRRMLAVISWVNKGSVTNDSDGFNAAFGGQAMVARANVVQAISAWQQVVTNFNYQDVGGLFSASDADKFFLTVKAGSHFFSERGKTDENAIDKNGIPWKATVDMDNDAGTAGWYFDQASADNVEFTQVVNKFTAGMTDGDTMRRDFLRSVTHEIGHALGISTDSNLRVHRFMVDAGTDAISGDKLLDVKINNSTIATFTENGGGHLYEVNQPIDLMSAGRVTSNTLTLRSLISDLDARILRDAYGYTVMLPSQNGANFLSVLDTTTHKLTITGDPTVHDGTITLRRSSAQLSVNVDGAVNVFNAADVASINIVGNGHSLTLDDLVNNTGRVYTISNVSIDSRLNAHTSSPPYFPTMTYANVSNVHFIGSTADDTFTVRTTDGGVPITIDASYGSDTLKLDDSGHGVGIVYTINATTLDRAGLARITYQGIENVTVQGGSYADTFNVRSTPSGTVVTLMTGLGLNHIEVGGVNGLGSILGKVSILGQGTPTTNQFHDILTINDQLAASGKTYTLHAGGLSRFGAADINFPSVLIQDSNLPLPVYHTQSVDQLVINGTQFDDTLTLETSQLPSSIVVNGGSGSDTLVGGNIANIWQITGSNAGTLNSKIYFNSVENLTGGSNNDRFVFGNGVRVDGRINGAAGSDTLDYAAYTTRVQVDLSAGSALTDQTIVLVFNPATGVSQIANSTPLTSIENVFGGGGDDVLTGNAADNILVGNGGQDTIKGNAGLDILIGGTGRDTLDGGEQDDVVIGDSTSYDANDAALLAIMAEWEKSGTYQQRTDRLASLPNFSLMSKTVFDDKVDDDLTGGGGMDWFWATLAGTTSQKDRIRDRSTVTNAIERINY